MRLWRDLPSTGTKARRTRSYETVGYVISGSARLDVEGQVVLLNPGDSWLVPAGAEHSYEILEELTAVEATSPPSHLASRDKSV